MNHPVLIITEEERGNGANLLFLFYHDDTNANAFYALCPASSYICITFLFSSIYLVWSVIRWKVASKLWYWDWIGAEPMESVSWTHACMAHRRFSLEIYTLLSLYYTPRFYSLFGLSFFWLRCGWKRKRECFFYCWRTLRCLCTRGLRVCYGFTRFWKLGWGYWDGWGGV